MAALLPVGGPGRGESIATRAQLAGDAPAASRDADKGTIRQHVGSPTLPRCRSHPLPTPLQPFLTSYDMSHLVTYLRLLDADEEGADWREVARIVLDLDERKYPEQTKRTWASHLARAKWMTEQGLSSPATGRRGALSCK